jgi:hypothetical protein
LIAAAKAASVSLQALTSSLMARARLEYHPGYYAADVFDPDGYSFEVVHKNWD